MTRKLLFDALRDFAPNKQIPTGDVAYIDVLADRWGIPRDEPHSGLKASKAAIDLIHSFESLKLQSYRDPGSSNGLPITNGWGSTSDINGLPIKLGATWTADYANRVFKRDIDQFSANVAKALGSAKTTQNQFDAMVSFAYNVGIEAFRTSTLLRKHKAADYIGAENEFHRWNKNDGRVMNGLIRRRKAEADLYAP